MIRYDHRNFDVQGTERVYKKVVHSGQNSIPLVDKDGIPMRGPNIASLTRLQSSYTVSPRGVPTKKSSHAYSGQLANAKLKNLVNDLNTTTSAPELISSYSNMQNYSQSFHGFPNGLSSAGSSRHYKSGVNSPKKRSLSTRQSQSVKSMAKSASSLRSIRPSTVSVPDQLSSDLEKLNESAQGKRLEKEWTNLTQCRALKRSSEIVSHRVDRMYFMTGNKLSLQSKYHVEDCELEQLRELQQARASSRSSSCIDLAIQRKKALLIKKRKFEETKRLYNNFKLLQKENERKAAGKMSESHQSKNAWMEDQKQTEMDTEDSRLCSSMAWGSDGTEVINQLARSSSTSSSTSSEESYSLHSLILDDGEQYLASDTANEELSELEDWVTDWTDEDEAACSIIRVGFTPKERDFSGARTKASLSRRDSGARTKASSSSSDSSARTKPSLSPSDSSARTKASLSRSDSSARTKPSRSPSDSSARTKASLSRSDSSARTKPSRSPSDSSARTKASLSRSDSSARTKPSLSPSDSSARTKASLSRSDSSARTKPSLSPSDSSARTKASLSRSDSSARTKPSRSPSDSGARTNASLSSSDSSARTKPSLSPSDSSARTNASLSRNDSSAKTKPSLSSSDSGARTKPSLSRNDSSARTKPSLSRNDSSARTKPSLSSSDSGARTKPSFSRNDSSARTKPSLSRNDSSARTKPSLSRNDSSARTKPSLSSSDSNARTKASLSRNDSGLRTKPSLSPSDSGARTDPSWSYNYIDGIRLWNMNFYNAGPASCTETMRHLFKTHPCVLLRARTAFEASTLETANECMLEAEELNPHRRHETLWAQKQTARYNKYRENVQVKGAKEPMLDRSNPHFYQSSRSRKGDIYRPDRLTQTSMEELEEGLDEDHVVITTKRSGMLHGNDRRFKENKDPHVMVSQKILTPKPNGTTVNNRKSPLLGWAGGDMDKDSTVTNTIISQEVAHRDAALNEERLANGNDGAESPGVEDEGEDYPDAITEQKAGNGELDAADGQTNGLTNGHTAQAVDHSEEVVEADAKHTIENRSNDSTNGDKTSSQEVDNDNGKGTDRVVANGHDTTNGDINDNAAGEKGNVDGRNANQAGEGLSDDNTSVQREENDDANSVVSDKDKIDIKTEDYLQ